MGSWPMKKEEKMNRMIIIIIILKTTTTTVFLLPEPHCDLSTFLPVRLEPQGMQIELFLRRETKANPLSQTRQMPS